MGKMRTRCQVCEGPIANGRCKLCGMPYRNDEVLYHLNERRDDHYRHATAKAKDIMRQSEVPLREKKTTSGAKKQAKQKKKSRAGLVTAIIICVLGIVPNIVDVAKQKYEDIQISKVMRDFSIEKESPWETAEVEEVVSPNEEKTYRLLSKADGKVKVGDWCPAGTYVIYIKRGKAMFVTEEIHEETGQEVIGTFGLTEEFPTLEINLEEGQTIYAMDTDTESRLIRMELISD